MNDHHDEGADREDRADEAIAFYLQAAEAGDAPDRLEWLARFADLAPELQSFFADLDRFDALAGPIDPADPADTVADSPRPDPAAEAHDPAPGQRIRYFGDYELISVIARGGMGIVYRARQRSLNRPVALKRILCGGLASEAELARFRNEAEAAANLDHPNIVPIYEVGTVRGQSYFSMKLIEGPSLADALNRFADDPRGSARLMGTVARAVHHAHLRGVLHRDLKPSNILLDRDGNPHVTDFGLAKRIEADGDLTLSGAVVGTPSYMSPEQAIGQRSGITTATDIYGLGAVLYALLSGRPPFRGDSVLEILDQVKGHSPQPPGRDGLPINRDLRVICLKCLEKDPQRRYASAEALAEDLDRWLRGEPIQARPAGRIERAWRWCVRNPAVASLSVVVAVLLVASVAGLAVSNRVISDERDQALQQRWLADQERERAAQQARRAEVEAERAEREAEITRLVQRFLLEDLLGQADVAMQDPSAGGYDPDITVRTLLDRAAAGVGSRFSDQPLVEAAIHQTLSSCYQALRLHEKARPHAERALELQSGVLGPEHPDTLTSRNNLGVVLVGMSDWATAEVLLRETLEVSRRVSGHDDPAVLVNQINLATTYLELGKPREAEALLLKTLSSGPSVLGPDHPWVLTCRNNLAMLYWNQSRLEESEAFFRDAIESALRVLGPDHPRTIGFRNNLGILCQERGQLEEAEALLSDGLERARRVLGPDHAATLYSLNGLAAVLAARRDFEKAEELYLETLESRRSVYGPDGQGSLDTLHQLAVLYHRWGKLEEAESLYRETLERRLKKFGPSYPYTLLAQNNLAALCCDRGNYAEAEPLLLATIEGARRVFRPDELHELLARNNLAMLYEAQGRQDEAESLLKVTLISAGRELGVEPPDSLTQGEFARQYWSRTHNEVVVLLRPGEGEFTTPGGASSFSR